MIVKKISEQPEHAFVQTSTLKICKSRTKRKYLLVYRECKSTSRLVAFLHLHPSSSLPHLLSLHLNLKYKLVKTVKLVWNTCHRKKERRWE